MLSSAMKSKRLLANYDGLFMKKVNGSRSDKVASEIKKVVSEYLIRGELCGYENIKTSMIVITDVVVSSCLRHVKIFVSSISDDLDNTICRDFLDRHSSQIRRVIGNGVKLKFVPEISFLSDISRERAQRIEDILNLLRK